MHSVEHGFSVTTDQLPIALYRADQVRALETLAIQALDMDSYQLMQRAGRSAFAVLLEEWPELHATGLCLHVFCGAGNNGGDGYIVAGLAALQGLSVSVYIVGDLTKLSADARQARQFAESHGVQMQPFVSSLSLRDGVVVDALLGIGARGELRADYRDAIQVINDSALPVLSVDLPSGVCADTGSVLGDAVAADVTVTFIGLKQGLLTAEAPDYVGHLIFADLGVPESVYDAVDWSVQRVTVDALSPLPKRERTAHKGHYGHVMVIGGDYGFGGAPLMAATAAARVGAGLVSVATRMEHLAPILARQPEVMAHPVVSGQELELLLGKPSVLIVGPGLGQTPWSEQLFQRAAMAAWPMVVDADALNLLANGRPVPHANRPHWILTPHPGEAARLLGVSTAEIQADRFASAKALQQKFGGIVVLKGAGTIVCDQRRMVICNDGNPGMATGGMGDVLSGVIGGLIAQAEPLNLSVFEAVCYAVAVHAKAADRAALISGERGLLAGDLFSHMRDLVNE